MDKIVLSFLTKKYFSSLISDASGNIYALILI